jgi:hypothetical protein
MRETGTGQQVAQLHDRYMMMMMSLRSVHTNTEIEFDIHVFLHHDIIYENDQQDATV